MANAPEPIDLTGSHHRADTRRADHDATLEAVHQLESALGAPAPGREETWRDNVLVALDTLDRAISFEQRNADEPDSLLSDLARTQPRLRNRVRGLRAQYGQVGRTVAALRQELRDPDPEPDFEDIRRRVAWLLTALRHQRGRESDLIYEAYYDSFNADIDNETAT